LSSLSMIVLADTPRRAARAVRQDGVMCR